MTDPNPTTFALLGALCAFAFVMFCVLAFGAWAGVKFGRKLVAYVWRFQGFQAGRDSRNQLTFSAKIDETPLDEDGFPYLSPGPDDSGAAEPEALN